MAEKMFLHEPTFEGNEWRYLRECLDSGWVSSAGPFVERFEKVIGEYTGAKHAVACVSGSAALQVALQVGGVKPGDEVIVPTLTFISPVNAIFHNGAIPVFMDVDHFLNLDVNKVEEFLDLHAELRDEGCWNKITGRRITAVMPVHVLGNAADLEALLDVAQRYQLIVVEDAAEGLGTRYRHGSLTNKHVGTVGNLGCLSFNGNKIITTGGGGMILTDQKDLADRCRYLITQAKDDPVRYVHNEVGYNFRLTNLQAALGVAQLEKLPVFLKRKREHYQYLIETIQRVSGLSLLERPSYAESNNWMNVLVIDRKKYGLDRDTLMDLLGDRGIQTRPIWKLNHLQTAFKDCDSYRIESAQSFVATCLCLPSGASLREHHMDLLMQELAQMGRGEDALIHG